MRNRYGIIALVCFVAAGSDVATAADRGAARPNIHHAYATVTDVQPIVRVVQVSTPRTTCWDEPVRQQARIPRYRSFTPAVVGGILGGLVGNQFGSGSGQTAMTIAGSLLGASVGRDASYRNTRHRRNRSTSIVESVERRCEVEEIRHEEERIEGFNVTYRFQGREYVTRMKSDPGPEIRVRVRVQPVGAG